MAAAITYLMILTSIVNLLNIVLLWRDKRSDKSDARFRGLENDLSNHHERLIKLEEAARRAPTHDDLGRVYKSIDELAKTVHHLVGQNERQTQLLNQLVSKAIDGGRHD